MQSIYLLRKGTSEDFTQLCEIYMHSSVNPFLSFEVMSLEKFKPIFTSLINSGDLYVYEHESKIIATCIIVKLRSYRCAHVRTLTTLAVHPEYQRTGVGSKFMNAIVTLLKSQQVKRIDLGAESDNVIALQFYEKQGFVCEGIFKKYVKRAYQDYYVDEHILALILD